MKVNEARTQAAAEIREAMTYDVKQRAEINHLRKMDQWENLQRRQSYDKVCKERLAEDILEKHSRGTILLSEQDRLKEMCYRQRMNFKGYYTKPVGRTFANTTLSSFKFN